MLRTTCYQGLFLFFHRCFGLQTSLETKGFVVHHWMSALPPGRERDGYESGCTGSTTSPVSGRLSDSSRVSWWHSTSRAGSSAPRGSVPTSSTCDPLVLKVCPAAILVCSLLKRLGFTVFFLENVIIFHLITRKRRVQVLF